MASRKQKKPLPWGVWAVILAVAVIAVVFALSDAGDEFFDKYYGTGDYAMASDSKKPATQTQTGDSAKPDAAATDYTTTTAPDKATAKPVEAGSSFEIHFIDVGQADCALVICDGQTMLIDGGNSDDSNLVYSHLKRYDITTLDYVVVTHAHEDHLGGVSGALSLVTSVGVAYCPVTSYDSKAFRNFVTKLDDLKTEITVPSVGDSFTLGSAEVTIIGPVKETSDTNNTSIVMRIVYGETVFLFTGDAEYEEENDILELGYDLSCTLLKVGHHGSSSSTSYRFLYEADPTYAIISVGKDNSYGHPHSETLSKLSDAGVIVYRTDETGDIICTSDGQTLSFEFAKIP